MSGEKLMLKNGTRRGEWGGLAWLCLVQSLRDVRDQIGRVTKLNQNRPIPPAAPPVHHNSGSMRSTPAGGEVSPGQYRQPVPTPPPAPTLEK
jgi:hypothetical protein